MHCTVTFPDSLVLYIMPVVSVVVRTIWTVDVSLGLSSVVKGLTKLMLGSWVQFPVQPRVGVNYIEM